MNSTFKYINFIQFKDLFVWDVKRQTDSKVIFKVSTDKLGKYINEQSTKYYISTKGEKYKILGINNIEGIYDAYVEDGEKINQKYKKMECGWLAYNPYRINVGSIGIKRKEHKNDYISPAYVVFSCKENVNPEFIYLLFKTNKYNEIIRQNTTGSVRQNLTFTNLSKMPFPLFNDFKKQSLLVKEYNDLIEISNQKIIETKNLENEIEKYLLNELGVEFKENTLENGLYFIHYKDMYMWRVDNSSSLNLCRSSKYISNSINEKPEITKEIYRGKSPKYDNSSNTYILNQRCIRWDDIEPEWGKSINIKWFESIDSNFLTKQNDILINSTGEGTIGRSSLVRDKGIGMLIDSHILLLRLNNDIISPEFFVNVFNSIIGQKQVEQLKSAQSTNQTELGINNLKKIKIPLPSIEKQNEIVNHISIIKKEIKSLREEAEKNKVLALSQFENEIFE